jgi:hypothetical protein
MSAAHPKTASSKAPSAFGLTSIGINPIVQRELRSRWRHFINVVLLLATCAFLAFIVCSLYASAYYSETYNYSTNTYIYRHNPSVERGAWVNVGIAQTCAWLFLAPLLASAAIASEREKGLLESMQLSALLPRQIYVGKLFSVLAYIGLIEIALMPISGICIFMGGVSPADVLGMTLLHGLTALSGASLGLLISASTARSFAALIRSLIAIIIWSVIPFFGIALAALGADLKQTLLLTAFHPVALVMASFQPASLNLPADTTLSPSTWLFALTPYAIQLFLCLWATCLLIRRPRAAPIPTDWHWLDAPQVPDTATTKNTFRQNAKASASTQSASAKNQLPDNALLQELPLAKWINFDNPILQREVRNALRFRRSSCLGGISQIFFAVLSGLCVVASIMAIIMDTDAALPIVMTWGTLLGIGNFLGGVYYGARSFSMERDTGMMEPLSLSLLSYREIIGAKLVAPIIIMFVRFVPAWLSMLLGVAVFLIKPPPVNDSGTGMTYLFPIELFAISGVYVATTFFVIAFSMLISHFSSKTPAATASALTFLILYFSLGIPVTSALISIMSDHLPFLTLQLQNLLVVKTDNYYGSPLVEALAPLFHPIAAISQVLDTAGGSWHIFRIPPVVAALINILFQLGVGFISLALVHRSLSVRGGRDPRNLDRNHRVTHI